ncbi:hypothetical protein ID866_4791 [Astraeus odoratus]|nr:hypothetical protein ID866_4791 [Astraeus odoratus]
MHWTLEPSFDSFDEDFAYSPNITVAEPVASLTLTQLSDFFAEDESTSSVGEVEFLVRLARTLLSTLTASYLDCAPVVFSPSMNPPDTALQLLTEAMEVTRTLYGKILQHDVDVIACCDDLKTLLGYLAGYFPFKPAHRDTKVEQIFQNLNVIYCELMSLMVLVSPYSGPGAGEAGHTPRFRSTPKAGGKLEIEIEHIHNYVIRLLDGESDLGGQLPRPLTPLVYLSLLPSIWALLCHLSGSATQSDEVVSSSVLSATLDHAIRTTSGSAVKRLTVEFVARLLLVSYAQPGQMMYSRSF